MGEAGGGRAESSPCALHARWEQIAAARARWPCQRPPRGHMLRHLPRSPGCSKGTGISSFPSPAPALRFWCHKHLTSPYVLTSNMHLHLQRRVAARVEATGRQPCPSAPSPSLSGLSWSQQCPEQFSRVGHAAGLQGGAAGKPAPGFGAGSTPQHWHLLGELKEPHSSLPTPRSPATQRGQAQLCPALQGLSIQGNSWKLAGVMVSPRQGQRSQRHTRKMWVTQPLRFYLYSTSHAHRALQTFRLPIALHAAPPPPCPGGCSQEGNSSLPSWKASQVSPRAPFPAKPRSSLGGEAGEGGRGGLWGW